MIGMEQRFALREFAVGGQLQIDQLAPSPVG